MFMICQETFKFKDERTAEIADDMREKWDSEGNYREHIAVK